MKCGTRLEVQVSPDGKKKFHCPYCARSDFESGLHRDLQLDDFILREKIGSGGMGEVWKARQVSMHRDVALKILSPELSRDKDFVKRFLNEAKMTGCLQHPNIITAYTAGNCREYYYLATFYVDGIELLDKIKIDGVLPEREALGIIKIIASALCYAWEQHRLLHCDIKPGNIMIDRYRTPYLMDMGISKIVSEEEPSTASKVLAGSLQYISPEQAAGDVKLDARTDIYSLGVTLYQMVTASLPFTDKQIETSVFKKAVYKATPAITKNPYVSNGCSELIATMMAHDRDERQSDWNYVIADIDAVIAGTYAGRKKRKVKKWDSIKKKNTNFNINAPINFKRDKKDELPEPEDIMDTVINLDTAAGNTDKDKESDAAIKENEKKEPPPKVFDASRNRRSGTKLLIILAVLFLIVCGIVVFLIFKLT
jgi:serine/threonine protein kinase